MHTFLENIWNVWIQKKKMGFHKDAPVSLYILKITANNESFYLG